jgi:hypothetical protein
MVILNLIDGDFSPNETLDLITSMVHAKIKFHENKISAQLGEEDTKHREQRIKALQRQLYDLRTYVELKKQSCIIHASVSIA